MKRIILISTFIFILVFGFIFFTNETSIVRSQNSLDLARENQKLRSFAELSEKAKDGNKVRIIIGLSTAYEPEGYLGEANVIKQRKDIKSAQELFLNKYEFVRNDRVIKYKYIPYLALTADLESLKNINSDPQVISLEEDIVGKAGLAESTQLVGAPTAWSNNNTGAGKAIAILDTGVEKSHEFLTGKVVAEGCFSSNIELVGSTLCPDGQEESTAVGSGEACSSFIAGCNHGTHVAGIAAGKGTTFNGVAKESNIIAIQIFHELFACSGGSGRCSSYTTSDLIKGLEYVKTLSETNSNIASVNLSIMTPNTYTGNCDAAQSSTKAAIDNLRSVNIATISISGNDGNSNGMTAPGCISTAISVGSVDDGSEGTTALNISNFSNSSSELDLLAPGKWIHSSVPGNNYFSLSGTSMAAPHVAGAFAIIRQKNPNASVDDILFALDDTGTDITDNRNNLTRSLIQIPAALDSFSSPKFDFDGDGKTDASIFRPSNTTWHFNGGQPAITTFGLSTDILVPADFSGDGITDIAVWRESNTIWYYLDSADNSFNAFQYGQAGDIPVPGDFDGDGDDEAAVYRPGGIPSNPSQGYWYTFGNPSPIPYGIAEDKPVVEDYDGDGKDDIAVFRPSTSVWYLNRSMAGSVAYQFGTMGDKTVQGDFTGDGKADVAIWRESNFNWYVLRSEDLSFYTNTFGTTGDIPTPGDYDGDGKQDIAVFRPSNNTWHYNGSTTGYNTFTFGSSGDTPIPSVYNTP